MIAAVAAPIARLGGRRDHHGGSQRYCNRQTEGHANHQPTTSLTVLLTFFSRSDYLVLVHESSSRFPGKAFHVEKQAIKRFCSRPRLDTAVHVGNRR
jgi:hypothetical protein